MHVKSRVKNGHTGTELNTKRFSCPQDRVTNSYTGCLFIHLDRCLVRVDTNDLCMLVHIAQLV